MVIIDIVINSLLGRLTLDPAGTHCPLDDAFVSSLDLSLMKSGTSTFVVIGTAVRSHASHYALTKSHQHKSLNMKMLGYKTHLIII